MKKKYLFLSFLLCSMQAMAQTSWLWAHNIVGGIHNAHTTGIATDADGNVYVTGNFTGTLALNNEYFTSQGGNDIFCVKYGPDGQPLWARAFGGHNDDNSSSIAVDAEGNAYIAGYFTDTISFGAERFISKGAKDMYLARLNSSGTLMWLRSWGTALDDTISRLCTDKNADIIFTATFSAHTDNSPVYNSIVLGNDTLTSTGDADVLLAKINKGGTVLWATHAGGKHDDAAVDLAVDAQGNIFIAGDFYGSAYFDSIRIAFPVNNPAEPYAAYIAKYNAAGKALWARVLPSSSAMSMALDSKCHLYLFCHFYQLIFNGGGYGGGATITHNFTLTHYDSSGYGSWQKVIDDMNFVVKDMGVDKLDQLYMTGRINNSMLIDSVTLNPAGHGDIFVLAIDSNAQARSAETIGIYATEEGTALCFDSNNNLFLTGMTGTQPVYFGTEYISAYNDEDVFIAKRGIPTATASFSTPAQDIVAYPSPADKTLYISIPSAKGSITLMDAMGKRVSVQQVSNTIERINTAHLTAGTYYLHYTAGNVSATRKILIEH